MEAVDGHADTGTWMRGHTDIWIRHRGVSLRCTHLPEGDGLVQRAHAVSIDGTGLKLLAAAQPAEEAHVTETGANRKSRGARMVLRVDIECWIRRDERQRHGIAAFVGGTSECRASARVACTGIGTHLQQLFDEPPPAV